MDDDEDSNKKGKEGDEMVKEENLDVFEEKSKTSLPSSCLSSSAFNCPSSAHNLPHHSHPTLAPPPPLFQEKQFITSAYSNYLSSHFTNTQKKKKDRKKTNHLPHVRVGICMVCLCYNIVIIIYFYFASCLQDECGTDCALGADRFGYGLRDVDGHLYHNGRKMKV
jgi:hypothetical protein